MNQKNLFRFIFAGIFIIYFVALVLSLVQTAEIVDYATAYSSMIILDDYVKDLLVVSLVTNPALILFISITLICFFVKPSINIQRCLPYCLLIEAVSSITTAAITIDYDYNDGSVITTLIFGCLIFILSFIAILLNKKGTKEKASNTLVIFSLLFEIVILSINVAGGELETSLPKAIVALDFISIILFFIGVLVYTFIPFDEIAFKQVQHSKEQPSNNQPKKESLDQNVPSENNIPSKLRELKSLYDDGILTKEEYEEKRKKLVDLL